MALNTEPMISQPATAESSLLLGTALAFASLILVPALAPRIGLNPSFAGAVRMALMRASGRVIHGKGKGGDDAAPPASFSCH